MALSRRPKVKRTQTFVPSLLLLVSITFGCAASAKQLAEDLQPSLLSIEVDLGAYVDADEALGPSRKEIRMAEIRSAVARVKEELTK